ncbi:hypothetical protein N0B16_00840 [Chryseobacterium sp. GMJ5]|uniref:Uncharacterized protein n=1 Tax=Chryseobacterium gilvum TaxID=2976534 RepID=A0ABT2VT90_9FLAO|nr:hypothetical protein [Chryseobacterium gilvum]MCU7612975.1 hypothetical protein [Chryseobacterium gilvum]
MTKKNNLIDSLELLSSSSDDQRKYLRNLFGNKYFNVDEILLEYEDAKFLRDSYNENIKIMFLELDKILEKIDEYELYNIDDLNNDIWNQVRNKSKVILGIINYKSPNVTDL